MNRRKRFGEILVQAGLVTEARLQEALGRQQGSGKRLGQVLEEMKVVTEKDIAVVLARQFGFKIVRNIARYSFSPDVLKTITSDQALNKNIFPLKIEGKALYLAMVNPLDMETLDNLSFETGRRIIPCVTTPSEIQEAVNKHYHKAEPAEENGWWTVLVVDDQELVRSAIIAALKKTGYLTLEATNGAEGIRVALQHFPHLIISDTVMPRMDGISMFRTLQANPATQKIPVIALSSRSAAEEEASLLDMGYFDFIPKPINPVRLGARVRRALKAVYGEGGPPAL